MKCVDGEPADEVCTKLSRHDKVPVYVNSKISGVRINHRQKKHILAPSKSPVIAPFNPVLETVSVDI